MEYERFLNDAQALDFVTDRDQTDAMVKAVLGVLASRLPEEQARLMTGKLPDPLTLDRLRGTQQNVENISFEQYVTVIVNQFNVDRGQAHLLISRVLRLTREAMGEETFAQLNDYLPADWVDGLEQAVSAAPASS